VADALETSRHLLGGKTIPSFWIGTARRKQFSVHPRRLHGLFAEPIVTRSGFSGPAVYLLGEDDRIYTASDVRPGDVQHARDAYLGGIEIGPIIQPAKELARRVYLGTDLTASPDGRLGRGKSIRIVEQGPSTWRATPIQERFRRPLLDQWNALYAQADKPADAQPAGWDFVFLEGKVLGALGPELLFEPVTDARPVRLAIENESESLFFRENLRMLSHAPGLRLQVIARVNLQDPRMMSAFAVARVEGDASDESEPRLEIPPSFAGRLCLGFDEIQRRFLVNAQASAVVLSTQSERPEKDTALNPLRRLWVATILSGIGCLGAGNARILRTETTALHRNGFATGAALLDALLSAPSERAPARIDTFLAAAIYLQRCSYELGRSRASFEN
jgi:hypothetical protein